MRIISNYHDYYDTIQSMGQDKDVIYLRKKEIINNEFPFIKNKHNITVFNHNPWHYKTPVIFYQYAIGFCNKVYGCLLAINNKNYDDKSYCYTLEDVDKFINSTCTEDQIDSYKRETGKSYWKPKYFKRIKPLRHRMANFFKETEHKKNSYKKLFEKYKAPLWIGKAGTYKIPSTITLNDELRSVEFYKVKDSYTTFQEIYMHIASQARPQEIIPKIDDKIMAEAKGFNNWSFRKESNKK